jgi:hypothetical protein
MRLFYAIGFVLIASVVFAQVKPASQPTTRPAGSGVKPVPPGELLDSLLKPPSTSGQVLQPIQEGPIPDASTGNNAVAPGAPQLNLLREGSPIIDRTARLTKSSDSQFSELTFDSDGKTMKDPPMLILPNLALMRMETAVAGASRDLRFKVSGTVTEYKGRNYILLEKVVAVPEVTQQF